MKNLKIIAAITALTLSPMLGQYIHDSVGIGAFLFACSMALWGAIDYEKD
jgi:hypothetical protein